MNGQSLLSGVTLQAVPQQPFTTMWPSYYAGGGGGTAGSAQQGDSSQQDDAAARQREREQRVLKRKLANRESAKRSKLKRQQVERELQEHARRVDDERESLMAQLAALQQRFTEAQAKQVALRRSIQGYLPGSGGGGAGAGLCG